MLPRLAIAVALACSIGLHWGFLQSMAWMGMVVNYSREGGVAEALVKTFDGKHPCALCKAIAKAQKAERKAEFPTAAKKFEFLYSEVLFVFAAPTDGWTAGERPDKPDARGHAPPRPPPKILVG
jgi:hypothetical protein